MQKTQGLSENNKTKGDVTADQQLLDHDLF
jgi:hypothetical protein